jgi:hypothetical protein
MDNMNDKKTWRSSAGPIQTKKVSKAISQIDWVGKTYTEIWGIKGKEEKRSSYVNMFGTPRAEAIEKKHAIGDKYDWAITRDNYQDIITDCEHAVAFLKGSIPELDKRTEPEEAAKREALVNAQHSKAEAEREAAQVSAEKIKAKAPQWATAAILAEYEEDQSDSMTDYFATKTTRRVVIGWRSGPREDFRQLRKAAATFSETVHLGPDAPKTIEHRDNYAMGGGNYLKASGHYSTGWAVSSTPIANLGRWGAELEDGLTTEAAAEPAKVTTTTTLETGTEKGLAVEITENEKLNGIEIHFPAKPSAEVLERLKNNGWRWSRFSRCWYKRRAPGLRELAQTLVQA